MSKKVKRFPKWIERCEMFDLLLHCKGYPDLCYSVCDKHYLEFKTLKPYVKPWCHVQLTLF